MAALVNWHGPFLPFSLSFGPSGCCCPTRSSSLAGSGKAPEKQMHNAWSQGSPVCQARVCQVGTFSVKDEHFRVTSILLLSHLGGCVLFTPDPRLQTIACFSGSQMQVLIELPVSPGETDKTQTPELAHRNSESISRSGRRGGGAGGRAENLYF